MAEFAGLEDPEKYEFPPPPFWEQLAGFPLRLPSVLEKAFFPSELILLEKLKQGFHPEFRYQ
ncbi:MAG: hypothetical protein C4554_05260 [Dethiobacter sp.]|nr:MAG: hypothetical protein C4554_05260 [Dethiobacter sp.]